MLRKKRKRCTNNVVHLSLFSLLSRRWSTETFQTKKEEEGDDHDHERCHYGIPYDDRSVCHGESDTTGTDRDRHVRELFHVATRRLQKTDHAPRNQEKCEHIRDRTKWPEKRPDRRAERRREHIRNDRHDNLHALRNIGKRSMYRRTNTSFERTPKKGYVNILSFPERKDPAKAGPISCSCRRVTFLKDAKMYLGERCLAEHAQYFHDHRLRALFRIWKRAHRKLRLMNHISLT